MSKVTTTFEAVDTGMVSTIQKIEIEIKSMKDTTEKAEKQINFSFGAMAKAGAGLAIGIGVVKGAFAALTGTLDQFGQALDLGGRLNDLSARTGETAGNLLLLERAFDNSGVGADKVGTAINKLQKFMSDANTSSKENAKALSDLGLSYSALAQLTPTEQMGMLAEKINGITSPTERAATAMKIFGKSGGELLPLLENFSGEIGNARDELGSMTGIMDAKSAVFDTISDKITIIKGKFMEFAAGLLSQVTPALELFTTAISKIDAAGLGERLANAFLGGQKAMDGFSSALSAMKIGEFGLAWDITFKSLKLQIQETFNQIHKYAVSTLAGIGAFMESLFGPGSAIISIFTSTFGLIGAQFEQKLTNAAINVVSSISGLFPMIGDQVVANLRESLKRIDHDVFTAQNRIGNGFEDIIPQAIQAGEAYGKAFEEKFEKTKPLIDTFDLRMELSGKRQEAAIKGADAAAKDAYKSLDLFTKFGQGAPSPLDPMKKDAEKISKDLKNASDEIGNIVLQMNKPSVFLKTMKDLTKQIEVEKAKQERGKIVDPLMEKFKEQLKEGKFDRAEKTLVKIAAAESEAKLRINEKGERDRRNVKDIARAEGINTIGKSNEEIRQEILEKREAKKQAEKRKEAVQKEEKKQEEDKQGKEKEEAVKKEDTLLDIVKIIRDLVQKIEPKLPTHALAL